MYTTITVDTVLTSPKIYQKPQDYNCSVEFFWSPFLVKLETKIDRTRALKLDLETKIDRTRALKLDQLPAMLQRTLGADVLVFNTGHWWTHTGKLRAYVHAISNHVRSYASQQLTPNILMQVGPSREGREDG
jgi:hypothetical protein